MNVWSASADLIPWLNVQEHIDEVFNVWKNNLQACFSLNSWYGLVCDEKHLNIALKAVSPPQIKMVYDSYLWRELLFPWLQLDRSTKVAELLPGSSLTIPVALESLGFLGHLYRIDTMPPRNLPNDFKFTESWVEGDILTTRLLPAKVFLGNHVLDDMIASQHFGVAEYYSKIYGNPVAEKEAWQQIASSPKLRKSINTIVDFFRRLFETSCQRVVLVLREYPASVSILNSNLEHIAAHSACFSAIISAFRKRRGMSIWQPDLRRFRIPESGRLPGSLVIIFR